MTKVLFEISMALHGSTAGPNDGPELPLGEMGERLHDWTFGGRTDRDAEIVEEALTRPGEGARGSRHSSR